jgi:hypothetical protein
MQRHPMVYERVPSNELNIGRPDKPDDMSAGMAFAHQAGYWFASDNVTHVFYQPYRDYFRGLPRP